jgi:hypothetical protein
MAMGSMVHASIKHDKFGSISQTNAMSVLTRAAAPDLSLSPPV